MNELQTFNSSEFGEIRAVEIDGEPWFVGKDVAAALGYKDTVNALKTHVDHEDKAGWRITTQLGEKETTVINESGVYSLVFASKLPKAKKFKRWVTSEVLPSIRKRGAYTAPQVQSPAGLEAFTAAIDTLTSAVQLLTQRMDALDQGGRKALPPLPAPEEDDNLFKDAPVAIKPPTNKMRRQWMRTASEKLNMLSDKCGLPSSCVLHNLYQELEEEQGVILSEVRLKALEEHQLTDGSILVAIFYETPLRHWFERRVDSYLVKEGRIW